MRNTNAHVSRLFKTMMVLMGALVLAMPLQALAFDFTVQPLIEEFDENEAYPGETLRGTITIRNNDTAATFYEPEVADFYYDDNGTMVFYESDNTPYPDNSLKAWINVETEYFKLEPDESRQVDYTITVPEDAQAGGHYGVVFFRSIADPDSLEGTGVATTGRLGTLMLVTVPGNITKSAELSDFRVGVENEQGNLVEQSEFETPPVSFAFTLVNTGNTYFEPQGTIQVNGFNLDETVEIADLKAFPNVPKEYIQTMEADKFLFGKYTATVNVTDGDGNQLPKQTVDFTVYNWKIVIFWAIIILVVLIILIGAVKKFSSSSKQGKK